MSWQQLCIFEEGLFDRPVRIVSDIYDTEDDFNALMAKGEITGEMIRAAVHDLAMFGQEAAYLAVTRDNNSPKDYTRLVIRALPKDGDVDRRLFSTRVRGTIPCAAWLVLSAIKKKKAKRT